ncbi:MAG: hypothetical protein DHS20C17_35800 [Cyclobacteriaceae bacterium]|nr:MAG: hypothetical protein DHS20C17_35800 [Cyclobacteriaceae bacterium]
MQRKDWLIATYQEVQQLACTDLEGAFPENLFNGVHLDGIIYCLGHLMANVAHNVLCMTSLVYSKMLEAHADFPVQKQKIWLARVHELLDDWVQPTQEARTKEEGVFIVLAFCVFLCPYREFAFQASVVPFSLPK